MKKYTLKIGMFLTFVVLFILSGEIVVRLSSFYDEQNFYQQQSAKFYRINNNLTITRTELIPNKEGEMFGAYVKINSLGFRGKEYNLDKHSNTFRILVLGDSVTFGIGVNNNDLYTEKLEEMLNNNSKTNYEVWNLGIIGYNTLQELELLKVKGINYNPDLVIIQYHENDLECPFSGCNNKLKEFTFKAYDDRLALPLNYELKYNLIKKSYFFRWISFNYDLLLWEVDIRNPWTFFTATLHNVNSPTWNSVKSSFSEFSKISENHDFPILLVIYPDPDWFSYSNYNINDYPHREIHRQVKEEGKKNNIYVIDLLNEYENYDFNLLKVREDDSHPSKFAHKLIAEEIYKKLKEEGLIDNP